MVMGVANGGHGGKKILMLKFTILFILLFVQKQIILMWYGTSSPFLSDISRSFVRLTPIVITTTQEYVCIKFYVCFVIIT